jgi:hypothetical protein
MLYNIGKNASDKTFKIGDTDISSLGVLYGGMSLVNKIGNQNEINQRRSIVDNIMADSRDNDYINVPYDRKYNNYTIDKFNPSSFKYGGMANGDNKKTINNPYITNDSDAVNNDMPLIAHNEKNELRVSFPTELHIYDDSKELTEHRFVFNQQAFNRLHKLDKALLNKFAALNKMSLKDAMRKIIKDKKFYSDKINSIIDRYIALSNKRMYFEDGGKFDATYDSSQNGYNGTNEHVSESQDSPDDLINYMNENPTDYNAIYMYNELFKDPPEITYDDDATDIIRRKHKPIQSVVSYLSEKGYMPSSVDSGHHNEGSKHYTGSALDLGLNTTFKGDRTAMQEFLNFYQNNLKEKFPSLKLKDERVKPINQKVWSGSHFHLEL